VDLKVGRLMTTRLQWQPLKDRPDLVAASVRSALDDLDALVAPIDPGLADTAAFCAEYGVPLDASANCLIVEGRRSAVTRVAAVVVLATARADVRGVVRRHLDVRKLSFTAHDDAVGRTGMEYGGITPIGLPSDWPVLVDEDVTTAGSVILGSGIRGSKLLVEGSALRRLQAAEILQLALPTPHADIEVARPALSGF
jgi:prolyl-tRNA editing enzyme YbaK/EbsC (Cys-tRNA(Pro) deacylase)